MITIKIFKGFQKGCTCTGDSKGLCSGTMKCDGAKSPYGADIGNMKRYSDMMNFVTLYDEDDDPSDPSTYDNNVISNFAKQFHTRECVMGPAGARTTLHRYQPLLTDTGLCGAIRAMRILALEFLSKNEKRSRKRRGAKCPRKGHTVLWRTFFRSCIG